MRTANSVGRETTDSEVYPAKFLTTVLNVSPHPVWVINTDLTVAFVNPAACTALGYGRARDLIGRQSHDALHPTHRDGRPYPAESCPLLNNKTECIGQREEWFFRSDGSPFPVKWRTTPIDLSTGTGVLLTFEDITDQWTSMDVRRGNPQQSRDRASPWFANPDRVVLLSQLKHCVMERFRDPGFGAEVLARENYLSLRHVQSLFASVDRSPAEFIRTTRLNCARDMLEQGFPLAQAWAASGFADRGTFGRAFKRHYGASPTRLLAAQVSEIE